MDRLFIGFLCFVLGAVVMFLSRDQVVDLFHLETPSAVFHGVASFYGGDDGFHGRCMADGRIYDKDAMTAAHLFLPLGTKVRVRYRSRAVILIITDRGPYKKGRIIDLSEAAARELQMIKRGVGRVTIEVLSTPDESETYHHQNPQCLKGYRVRDREIARTPDLSRFRRYF